MLAVVLPLTSFAQQPAAPAPAIAAAPLPGATPPPRAIPDALKPWVGWAAWDDPQRDCPTPYNDAQQHLCFWPSQLTLAAEKVGGRFELSVTVYHESWIPLPGGTEAWPLEVTANGAPLAVVEHASAPSIQLPAGTFRLAGKFRWPDLPQRIPLPRSIGLLALTLDGQSVAAPAWDAQGMLWLKRDGSSEEADKDFLAVKIYAALEDGIPLWLRTEIELTVSGKSREEDLGTILPEGWKLASVESPIPVAIDDAGRMKAQVRAGKWTVRANAFRADNPKDFRYAESAKPAVAEELVAFRSRPDFRMIEITGATAIDVSQTTFPDQWRELPVYRWDTPTPFRLEERMRGMGEQKPAGLQIGREWWLDENGRALTFRDTIAGQMQQIWRLDAAEGQDLGSVRSRGQGQLITRNPQNSAPGVEIRSRTVDLEATGRMDRAREIPATGWRSDADALQVTLNLPPGWRLFALFGADWVRGDWLTAWTLLDLFLLLIFTLAIFRLWGFVPAVLAFLAFGLSYHEPGAPRYSWLILLVPLALLRVVPEGWGRRVVNIGRWLALAIFVLVLVPFVARQVQQALYPQLEIVNTIGRVATFEVVLPTSTVKEPEVEAQPVLLDTNADSGLTERIQRKLNRIIIPKLEFRETTLMEAIEFLKKKSVELDVESAEGDRGVNIVVNIPEDFQTARISVSLSNVPLIEALRYVTGLANLKYKIEPYAVTIVPLSENTEVLTTKQTVGAAMPGLEPADASRGYAQRSSARSLFGASVATPKENLAYDAKARIQTGPGVPEWKWRTVSFGWNGPVQAAQNVRPVLISVGLERTLSVLRVALLLALAAILLEAKRWKGPIFRAPTKAAAAVLLLTFAMIVLPAAQAQVPDAKTLEQLRERLLKPSDAYPTAADIPTVTLKLQDRRMSLDAEIHTAIETAVPLPGRLPAWSPVSVTVDGKPAAALRRDDGYLWVVLAPGVHRVLVEGSLAEVTEWEWTFLLKPRQVAIDAPGWTFSGVRPDGSPEAQIFFALKQKAAAGQASYDRQDLQSIAVVDRHIELGLLWQVRTTVTRLSPLGKAIALRVPLLPGENVLSSNAVVKDGVIEVRLGAQEPSFSWESGMAIGNQIALATRAEDTWVERWHLVASPVWNVELSGLAPIFEPGNPDLVPVWQPWPGEQVALAISRPEAIAGATVTVSRATHEITVGKRQRVSKLDLVLRCSVGEDFLIDLPADAEITALAQNGKSIPVRKDGNKVIVPLRPGEQGIALSWKINGALGFQTRAEEVRLPVESGNIPTVLLVLDFRTRAEEVRLPVESANITTILHVPEDRWVLGADGPRRGPAVRFWGILVCSLLAAAALGRVGASPLKTIAWMLLVIGLTQVPLPAALVVVGWLFFLEWRGRESFQRLSPLAYNFAQVALIALTATALGILITAVGEGLLGSPEMFIIGNDSSRTMLRWFQARSEVVLPRPGFLSISIWWYRLLMLAWALWLAASLIRWLSRGWKNFCTGGCFRKRRRKVAVGPPPLPTKPAPSP